MGVKEALAKGRGIISYTEADRAALNNAVRRGRLIRLFPRTYVDAALYRATHEAGRVWLRQRAAARYCGSRGALSHLSALDLWGLRRQGSSEPIHLSVAPSTRLRAVQGVVVHRRRDFEQVQRAYVQGVSIVNAAEAVVGSWQLLSPVGRRPIVIEAVRRRVAKPDQLSAVAMAPRVKNARELSELIDLLASGCQSELEIWGALEVFVGPGMPSFQRQVPVKIGSKLFYLDVYARRERVAFELDGAAGHGDQVQRERDIQRDSLLAACGVQVVRYSYRRLMTEPELVRREVLAILAARRSQLRLL